MHASSFGVQFSLENDLLNYLTVSSSLPLSGLLASSFFLPSSILRITSRTPQSSFCQFIKGALGKKRKSYTRAARLYPDSSQTPHLLDCRTRTEPAFYLCPYLCAITPSPPPHHHHRTGLEHASWCLLSYHYCSFFYV